MATVENLTFCEHTIELNSAFKCSVPGCDCETDAQTCSNVKMCKHCLLHGQSIGELPFFLLTKKSRYFV